MLESRGGFEAVQEQGGGDGDVGTVRELGRLLVHWDNLCEVGVARGGGGKLEGPGAEEEGEEERQQVHVAVDMEGVRALSEGGEGGAPSGGEHGLDGREDRVARWWEGGLESGVDARGQLMDGIVGEREGRRGAITPDER